MAAAKNVRMWLTKVRKIKSIYHTLNLFNIDVTQKVSTVVCGWDTVGSDSRKVVCRRGTVALNRSW